MIINYLLIWTCKSNLDCLDQTERKYRTHVAFPNYKVWGLDDDDDNEKIVPMSTQSSEITELPYQQQSESSNFKKTALANQQTEVLKDIPKNEYK